MVTLERSIMLKRKIWPLAAVPLVAIAMGFGGGAAQAAPATIAAGSNADGYVIVNPAAAEQTDNGTFYPTGQLDASTLVVIPNADGSLPNGLTTQKLQSLHSDLGSAAGVSAANKLGFTVAGGAAATTDQKPASAPAAQAAATPQAAAASHAWAGAGTEYSRSYNGPSIIGADASVKVNYSFSIAQGFNQTVAGQGLGYYTGYNGSVFGTYSKFYTLSSADSNTAGGGSVPWGNVAAVTQLQVKCATSTICQGTFTVNGQ